MPVRNVREYYCPHCKYIETLEKDEPEPKRCPACSCDKVYVGKKSFTKKIVKKFWNG